jgi:hypothetical protein
VLVYSLRVLLLLLRVMLLLRVLLLLHTNGMPRCQEV